MSETRKKLTIPDLALKKAAGERLVMVAVGEVLSAAWAERAGVDIIGVGDSLGMVMHGMETTVGVPLDLMIMHGRAVVRGTKQALIVVDMPFGTYEETAMKFGPYGALGGEYYLGPGALLLEVQYATANLDGEIFDGASAGALDVLAGYRLFL